MQRIQQDRIKCVESVSRCWRGGENENTGCPAKRICITNDQVLNREILLEHEMYKATGSIEAQACIDTYILPSLMQMYYCIASSKRPGDGRTIVPNDAWETLARSR